MIFGEAPPAALARFPGFLMSWVGHRSRVRFHEAMTELGLHPREFAVLTILDREPGSAQQELTRASGVDASTMVALLDGLAERGLAERRPHPTDRRKRAVYLTEAGQETLREARRTVAEVDKASFGVLTAEEREELVRLLRKLAGL